MNKNNVIELEGRVAGKDLLTELLRDGSQAATGPSGRK